MTLPYAPGAILDDTRSHLRKLDEARRHIRHRAAEALPLHNVSGLDRRVDLPELDTWVLDDEWAGALYAEPLHELGLEHLGGESGRDDVLVTNRLTAALYAAMQVTVRPGSTVVGVSPSYSHPAVARAVRDSGGHLVDTTMAALAETLAAQRDVSVVALTRLAVTYDALSTEELHRVVELAHAHGALVVVDDAGGARVGPAVLGQPRTLELDADLGATGLDKYGVGGPRVGLLGGRADLIAQARARAFELGSECRPALYPAVVQTLQDYRPERVRELVAQTHVVGAALRARLGDWVEQTPFITRLPGAGVLAELARRKPVGPLAPIEATAALAMTLLRDHGLLTVHFAGLPPGTDALLIKFLPPETITAIGGPDAFAAAVDDALDQTAAAVTDLASSRALLHGP
ncbi:aminotransferase class I/II-fold pyridoxal phosphate-dependent enzyme [Crossiella sp. CA-258035]|uniref:aminotransferase class I/II-fold pyridoxal phosphate-dependent enzyme n=1 Tax=Crossiella sp. CA-258035 TaxID=2981138 RepID=UPI0024BC2B2C|nr:aminotransferase class I/II-fold pyridoxal phosphate-dependent enzyme [Crossiella sp. CA-258035]WHT16602.1 aminotransferase class I/II-fold pyridoxal phosphate-dependent enzyme [Crossiella sp. CA-258035]